MDVIADRPTSKKRAALFIKAAMQLLDDAGGSPPLSEIKREVEKRVQLTDHDRSVSEKSGYIRWESVLQFYSIDCVKAGFIRKSKGRWWLTPEGKGVLPLPPEEIIERRQERTDNGKRNRSSLSKNRPERPENGQRATSRPPNGLWFLKQLKLRLRKKSEVMYRSLVPMNFRISLRRCCGGWATVPRSWPQRGRMVERMLSHIKIRSAASHRASVSR